MLILPAVNPKKETEKIGKFISQTLKSTGLKNLVIGFSGGIDSTTSLYLSSKAIPSENIFIAHLYYF